MSRLVRLIDESEPSEDVMVLGGEHGVVTLYLPGGCPNAMVLHSPVEVPGWDGPHECERMEVPCWCLSSVTGTELRAILLRLRAADEGGLWIAMEDSYRLYLQRGRR